MIWLVAIILLVVLWLVFRTKETAPKAILTVSLFLVVVLAALFWSRTPSSSKLPDDAWLAAEQRPAIDLSGSFQTLDGDTISLDQIESKALFLNVWATWCGPCRLEMPSMAELYRELGPQGLQMVAVTDEDAETVRAFLAKNRYPFTVLLDPDNTLSSRFDISAIPTTFIVDDQGRLAYRHVGYNQWNSPQVRQEIAQLLE